MKNNLAYKKDYLNQAKHLDATIDSKLVLLESLNSLATKATQTFSDMPHSPNRGHSSLEDTICKIIDLQDEINRDIDHLVNLKRNIANSIEKIPDSITRTIFLKRYLGYMTWEDIAEELNFSVQHTHYLHRSGLAIIKLPLDNDEKND